MEFLNKINLKDPKHIVGILLVGYLIYYLYTEYFTDDKADKDKKSVNNSLTSSNNNK